MLRRTYELPTHTLAHSPVRPPGLSHLIMYMNELTEQPYSQKSNLT